MQRVLVVDDSKTAQLRLKKMLSRYDLIVDAAFSAEEALGYLTYRTPAVIFMDHHMEGMDGFEALKIIKANANTAMIPVIMYTAQKGDVYVGQARALGALDILSKEVIKPSSLERALSSLKIVPRKKSETPQQQDSTEIDPQPPEHDTPKPPEVAAPAAPQEPEDASLEQVRSQVARLFEMHVSDVRQQITDNSRFIVRRLSAEMEKTSEKEATVGDVPLSVVNAEMNAEQRRSAFVSSSLLFLIFLGLALLAYELFSTKNELKQINDDYDELVNLNTNNQQLISSLTESLGSIKSPGLTPQNNWGLMSTISWALEADMQFAFNALPLDEQQMLKVSNLVYRLASAGFSGNLALNIHFGNFCLETDSAGNWQLADPASPAQDCTLLSDLDQDFSVGDYLSLPYMNFEQNAAPLKEGTIEVDVLTSGLEEPRYEYPTMTRYLSAAEWNAAASRNNRVAVEFGE
ncbi:Response regulator containing a CheY-like receiver domain and a GGDEF domain [Alteromonadaceae bacterium Bs31]|nr:Response regulator containing a CheY-like receiver domain and a GGDEF domain [Alteromonadaceae bacterium Bs31]